MSSATEKPESPEAPAKRPAKQRRWMQQAQGPLAQAGEMVQLLGDILVSAIRQPVGYWGTTRDQMYSLLKLCWVPLVVSVFVFGLAAPGLQGGNIMMIFGIPERLGAFFIMASVREFAPFVTAMVVAGVVGTSITADLGARRIREEIDAMQVLGVSTLRELVIPRVIAVTIMTTLLDLVSLVVGVLGGYVAAVWVFGANPAAFYASFFDNATTPDIWGSVVKSAMFGLIIGVVCTYKGINAQGGPIGVGRAVNHAVVIAFALIFIVDWVFTTILLGLNPQIQVYK